jgi:hypothetical protein
LDAALEPRKLERVLRRQISAAEMVALRTAAASLLEDELETDAQTTAAQAEQV